MYSCAQLKKAPPESALQKASSVGFFDSNTMLIIEMRKKVNDKEALKYDIKLRVNQQHYDRLCLLLLKSHYKNMSELLRDIVCERQVVTYMHDESLGIVMEELTRIRKELNTIGVNVNQVVKRIHQSIDRSKILLESLDISEQLRVVEQQQKELFPLISQLAKKWLQG